MWYFDSFEAEFIPKEIKKFIGNDNKCKNKCRKIKNPKISYIFDETVLSIICDNCGSKDEKIFKKQESFKVLKLFSLINNTKEWYISYQLIFSLLIKIITLKKKYGWRKHKPRI